MRFPTQHLKDKITNLKELIKINTTPRKIALAVAIAIFWNFLPVLGLGSILTFIVAKLLKGSEIIAVAFHLGTGFLIPVFYALNYITGRILLGGKELEILSPIIVMLHNVGQFLAQWFSSSAVNVLVSVTYDFLVGSIFNAVIAFLLAYLVTKFLCRYRERHYNFSS
ncbi:DUF2062 domain-containing protein [Natranaerobius thermophilus]|uniref:DUF2062 domain-containing protein n=1 Tax=Natranaerobius thermophilus (strain ATCC BAA-1301 / DSM 18059 / JW/NM-WN-LF) TaxID=457570 RepID=B2A744_NATTJ|nr:DUF2062 domain-containing protein [Natranaerobius thermophilus]ACB85635.1 conserved hypothetical protein [Natranaerobius thermophilus JW/NM-WN-LF]